MGVEALHICLGLRILGNQSLHTPQSLVNPSVPRSQTLTLCSPQVSLAGKIADLAAYWWLVRNEGTGDNMEALVLLWI